MFELDDDGYPTDQTLTNIENWGDSPKKLMESISSLFIPYGKCELQADDKTWIVVTGGWSGCETVIRSLRKNWVFWTLSWELERRGGLYEFETDQKSWEKNFEKKG